MQTYPNGVKYFEPTDTVSTANFNTALQSVDEKLGSVPSDSGDTAVAKVSSLILEIDTRQTILTRDAVTGLLTKVEEKAGAAVVKITDLNYDGSGVLTTIVEAAGGTTVTSTLHYDANGNLTNTTKAVI